jgi:cell division GTPase FtsZ
VHAESGILFSILFEQAVDFMKIIAIGIGQCGGRIADEFDRLNKKAKSKRGLEIVTGTFAVDTDTAALSELESIKANYRRRILVGIQVSQGHGKVKINKIGAEIFKKEADKIIDTVRLVKRFQETDAILIVASGAGGTGSGGMPIILQDMKERYKDKAVYGLVVFPFDHEIGDEKLFISNTASCLKSSYAVSDGIFLVDNQKFIQQDPSLIHNMARFNQLIAEPFYNLLCAGEEKNPRHIGSKLMDAGDIIQTIKGWTVLGHGESHLSLARRLLKKSVNFNKKSRETDIGIKVVEEAIGKLTMKCNPADAAATLYLLAAPAGEISMNLLNHLGDYLKGLAPNAVIRSGDYPTKKSQISIDVVLSQLEAIDRVREIYEASVDNSKRENDLPTEN